MFRTTIIVLFLEQAAVIVFGILCTTVLMGAPVGSSVAAVSPPPSFAVLVRDHGWWLGFLPLCWALTMSRVGRAPDGKVLTQRILRTGGMLLALLLCIATVSVWVSYLHLRGSDEFSKVF